MDWLDGVNVPNVGVAAGFIAFALYVLRSIVLGKLVPEAMHERIVAAKDDQIDTLQSVKADYSAQIDTLLDQGRTTHRLLRSIAPDDDEAGTP